MTYSFNRAFTGISNEIFSALPQPLSSGALSVIIQTVGSNPNATQKDILQALYNDINDHGTFGVQHEDLYLFVLSQISELENGVLVSGSVLEQNDQSAWLWIRGAIGVNTDDGAFFSDFIRDQTAAQYKLRYGTDMDINKLQEASDNIALAFVRDILSLRPDNVYDSSININNNLPPTDRIGGMDAAGVAASVFKEISVDGNDGNYSPWAGTILFPYLGVGEFTQDWLLTSGTNEFKKISGTYDLISVAQVAWDVVSSDWLEGGNSLSLNTASALYDTFTNNSIGYSATVSLLAGLRNDANSFFQNYYGLPNEGRYQIGGDLPLYGEGTTFGILTNPFDALEFIARPNYIVGKLTNDIMNKSAGEFSGDDVVNLGLGDDYLVQGSFGNDLIDGAEGNDTLDYLKSISGLKVEINELNAGHTARYIAEIEKYKGLELTFKDLIYNIETIKGSIYEDVFHVKVMKDGLTLDGSADTDTLDTFYLTAPAEFHVINGTLKSGGITTNFSNFEAFGGTNSGDDVFIDALGKQTYNGYGGVDTLDYSNNTHGAILYFDGLSRHSASISSIDQVDLTDVALSIEHFILTSKDDVVKVSSVLGSSTVIDGNGAQTRDTLDFSSYTTGIDRCILSGFNVH